jgi:lauroyl/myristoyl acyltransferase/ADP-heptose:LPS heptosyltransferase
MIFRFLIGITGYFTAHLPPRWVELLCWFWGQFFFTFFRRRRRIILSNFAHAFPEKTHAECKILAQESCARMVELGLLAVALPYFSEKRIRRSIHLGDSIEEFFREKVKNNGPRIILLPHFSQMEALTAIPLLSDAAKGSEIGVIYRPFANKVLERWIRRTRERFGLKLLARGNDFWAAKAMLERGGIVVILFDQNANEGGILATFFGRGAATTYLPDLLYRHFSCPIYMLMPRRTGIFRAKCSVERLPLEPKIPDDGRKNYPVIRAMNTWLERKLSAADGVCCDWLWAHNRWRTLDQTHNWLSLPQRRRAFDDSEIEKKVKIFIRMPNWLGDIIMTIPAVKAICRARPDAKVTLIVRKNFVQFLKALSIADRILPIGRRANGKTFYPLAYYRQLLEYRRLEPDFLVRIGNDSTTGDIEVLLMNPKLSFAPRFVNKKRPYFSECITMDRDSPAVHQVENLRYFIEKMGYQGDWDLAPIDLKIPKMKAIGLICGSENNPEKRWPISHWIALIEVFLGRMAADIVLFGTPDDAAITREIKGHFPDERRLIDRAGKTNLLEFRNEIAACELVIGNDTGGVHLSNFLGIPTVILFGPTNLRKTRPIFDAPIHIIRSPDTKNFSTLAPNAVANALSNANLLPPS